MLFSKCKINKNLEKHTSNNDLYHSILLSAPQSFLSAERKDDAIVYLSTIG